MSEEILGTQLLGHLLMRSRVLALYLPPTSLRLNQQRLRLPQHHLRKRNQTVVRRAAHNRAVVTRSVPKHVETRRIGAKAAGMSREVIRRARGQIGRKNLRSAAGFLRMGISGN